MPFWRSSVLESALVEPVFGRPRPPGGVLYYCKARRLGLRAGCFASDVEFSKGYRHFASVITLAKCGIAVKTESVAPPQPAPVSNDRTGTGIGALPSARVCFGEGEVAAGQENGHRSVAVGKGNGNWGRESGIGAGKLPAPIRRSLPQCEPAPCADGYGIHRGAGPATGGYTARPLCGWLGRWPRRPSDDEELRVRCVARSHPRKSAASQGPGPSGCSRGASGADPSTPPVKVRSSSSRSGCG